MNRRAVTIAVAGGVAALIAVWATGTSRAQQPGFKRVEVQRHDLGVPGREVVQVRAEFAPGAAIGMHTHPGEEVSYVLEGTVELDVAGKPSATIKAGEPLFVPAETPHAAKNVGKGPAVVLATYIVEKGKPLSTPVKQAAAAEAPKK
jgi:quercetin dioxygenase-like cupin family protein